jgi:hypothetical protein
MRAHSRRNDLLQTEVVVRGLERFREKRWNEIRTLDDLERVMARFPDDQAATRRSPSTCGATTSGRERGSSVGSPATSAASESSTKRG